MILTMRNGTKIYVNPEQIAMIEQAEVTKDGQLVYRVKLSSGDMLGCADAQLAAYLPDQKVDNQMGNPLPSHQLAPTVWDRLKGSI